MENFSYSKLEVFNKCPYKYKLIYIDHHYIKCDSIATDFGKLIHHIEEKIGLNLKNNNLIDYEELKKEFILKLKDIENKYKEEFYLPDKTGKNYKDKAEIYLNSSIYRLEKRVKEENLEVVACEKNFVLEYKNVIFKGAIDRILKKKGEDLYIIEDIKTYTETIKETSLINPLQFVIYSIAFSSISKNIECNYDLPICECIQKASIKYNNINDILKEIEESDFHPSPTPLCHWCIFSDTFPNQPKEAKGLCPYYSQWTRKSKNNTPYRKWEGIENNKRIIEEFRKEKCKEGLI